MTAEIKEVKYLFFQTIPTPKLSNGRVVIEYHCVAKDPYDIRIEKRVLAGEPPPDEPPVELAQNE